MRVHFVTLMGNGGFGVVLARAVALAGKQVPWLRGVRLTPDAGDLLGQVEALAAPVEPQEVAAGRVVVVAQLLGLLVAFIGEVLMLRLVREIWPGLSLNVYFEKGDEHERTE